MNCVIRPDVTFVADWALSPESTLEDSNKQQITNTHTHTRIHTRTRALTTHLYMRLFVAFRFTFRVVYAVTC